MERKVLIVGIVTVLLVLFSAVTPVAGQEKGEDKPGFSVTVYNAGYALIKDRREMTLEKGLSVVKFTDVAAQIDATSVRFVSLTDPAGTGVVEQNYEFDLVSADKILQKYIDKPIRILTKDGKVYEGTLMSFDRAQVVLAQEGAGISMVERGDNIKNILFSKLPEGLLTRPTLVWLLDSDRGGKQLVKVSYVAGNIKWRTDYTLVIDKDEKLVDMSGWVTIDNKSGTGYKRARIKLLAGDTGGSRRRQLGWGPEYYKGLSRLEPTAEVGAEKGERFSDFYLYRLDEPSTINNNQVKQIELLNATRIPVKKIYVYDGAQFSWSPSGRYLNQRFGSQNKKVNVLLELENRKAHNLGFSLPMGKIRVYKRDDDGSLEFIGEDKIDHTPRDEKVTLYIGDAFDIVGERKQVAPWQKVGNTITERFEIKVKNHKKEAVTVKVVEKMYRWHEWKIIESSDEYKELNSRTVEFAVNIPADGEKVIKYTVRYQGF